MIRCTVCRHTARATPPELRQMFPYPLRLQTAAHLLRCSECGAKGQVHIAPVPAQARCVPHLQPKIGGRHGPEWAGSDGGSADVIGTALAAGLAFACTPVRVWDGDGPIWCAEGPKIRLAGVAAREMDGSCRPGHPCPAESATGARDRLVALLGGARGRSPEGHVLVRGPTLQCRSTGSAGGSRTAAWCSSPRIGDLSCAMVRTGAVLRWERYWRDHRCPPRPVEH